MDEMKELQSEKCDKSVLVQGADDEFEQEVLSPSDSETEVPIVENREPKPFDPRKINVNALNVSMHSLLARIRNDRIDMAPDFQRNAGIWTAKAKTRLIESLLIRLPLPAFYFDATNDDRWIVIDGLQRLTTIKEFVIDQKWPLQEGHLEFLGKQCGGKFYSDLSVGFQGNIDEAQVVACKVLQGTPSRVKFDIFRRINTGGLPLNSQEIRHALNAGPITRFLGELAGLESFRNATGRMNAKRMTDRECVLRFLAFYEDDPATYKNHDFDRYLNDYMESFNKKCEKFSAVECQQYQSELRTAFERAMKLAVDLFGDDAFRKRYELGSKRRYQVNKALFEAWAVNLARVDDMSRDFLMKSKDRLRELFVAKMHDAEFDASVSQSTANASSIQCRFRTIRQIIDEVVYA